MAEYYLLTLVVRLSIRPSYILSLQPFPFGNQYLINELLPNSAYIPRIIERKNSDRAVKLVNLDKKKKRFDETYSK